MVLAAIKQNGFVFTDFTYNALSKDNEVTSLAKVSITKISTEIAKIMPPECAKREEEYDKEVVALMGDEKDEMRREMAHHAHQLTGTR